MFMTQPALCSSSITYGWTYDVFLSFRGTDTRYTFTGNLYDALCRKGIRTFIDDEELQNGEEITPALLKAIEESRMAIIVFSENYASSTFCLQELVKILECIKQKDRLVLPVFYHVEPCDVRHQKEGSYKAAMAKHEARFANDMHKVQNWRLALRQAASLSGCHIRQDGCKYEYKYIDEVTEVISKKIKRIPLHIANYPVGLDSRGQEVSTLLDTKSGEGVNMIGIFGIGGIGKTTTACAVYNLIADQFEGLCFLADIRENSTSRRDLVQLQEKLLAKVLGEDIKLGSVKEGISVIKHWLQRKKVLLILDDVAKLEQLQILAGGIDWFGSGSRIMITTRDKHLLHAHGVERIYEVAGLNHAEAIELFSWNTFKSNEVDPSYVGILEHAVFYSKGLPLALEVIGSNLCGKSPDKWKSALDAYERVPNKDVQEILKVSYDGLAEKEKEIFLDISCFFKGAHLRDVTNKLLNGRGFNPEYHIQVLIDKSLIRTDLDSIVRMHDLIQDMGRDIVRQESPLEPGKRSRLWFHEDILHVLQANTGTENIEVIMLNLPYEHEEVQWNGEALKEMKNLKVLVIRNAQFSRGPTHLPSSLRMLDWEKYPSGPLPSDCDLRKLVILNLPSSHLTSLKPLKKLESLSYLNFSYCNFLKQVPDVSGAPNLKELHLRNCKSLIEVDDSVGFLDKLRVLDASGCTELRIFPHAIKLKSLEFLDLSSCSSFCSFPDILGKMEKLTSVDLSETAIEELPFSIQNLVGLRLISLDKCKKLYRLPSSILTLPVLKELEFDNCERLQVFDMWEGQEQERVSSLVSSNLSHLSFCPCKLTDEFFHTWLPCFSYLESLFLRDINIKILPACINEFRFLKEIRLIDCKQLREIRGVPPKIEKLFVTNCTSLSSHSSDMLLSQTQELHEEGGKYFILPGARIPEWFHHRRNGPSLSFWFQNKFPNILLCVVAAGALRKNLIFHLIINSNQRFVFYLDTDSIISCGLVTDHIFLFDLQVKLPDVVLGEVIIKHGWNHVEVSHFYEHPDTIIDTEGLPKWIMGVHAYNKQRMMEIQDIRFTNPNTPKRKFDDI